MARSFHRKRETTALAEINVTSLLDLTFCLLIIFMITTPLLEQTISIDLPEQRQNTSSRRPEKVQFQAVSIDKTGQYFWGDQPVSASKLEQLLRDLSIKTDPPVLSIRADSGIPYQKVIDLMDKVKAANLTKISFDTQVK